MVEYKSIKDKYKYEISDCPFCGGKGEIYDFVRDNKQIDGIGNVGCENVVPYRLGSHLCKSKVFHYSGKCYTSKSEAILKWNIYCKLIKEKGEEYGDISL